jgi:hypothetical protein
MYISSGMYIPLHLPDVLQVDGIHEYDNKGYSARAGFFKLYG